MQVGAVMETIGIHGTIRVMALAAGAGTIHGTRGTAHGIGHHGVIHIMARIGAMVTAADGTMAGTAIGDMVIITETDTITSIGDLADLRFQVEIHTEDAQAEQWRKTGYRQ